MIFDIFKRKKPENKPDKPSTKAVETPEEPVRIFQRLKRGLQRTRSNFSGLMSTLLGTKKIDASTQEALMRVLLTSDVGLETAEFIIEETQKKLRYSDDATVDSALRETLTTLLAPSATHWELPVDSPAVILFVGVNGSGKTTTIGRIGHAFQKAGKRVLLAAGDTFRAAAIEQLLAWGKRIDSPVVAQKQGADSAAVLFEAMHTAQSDQVDILLGDTAGRLHNQTNLMHELTKVKKVIKKQKESAPHEVWLVLDATVGQNGLKQAQAFKEAVGVTGVILTKLDGSAKGGIIFSVSQQLNLPIRFIGIGEKETDLIPFNVSGFVDALLEPIDG